MGRYRNIGVVDPDAADMVSETAEGTVDSSVDGEPVPGNDDIAVTEDEKMSEVPVVEQEEQPAADA